MVGGKDYNDLALRESPDAVIVTTLEGEILHWNPGAVAVFGFTQDEAVGRHMVELLVPPNRSDEENRLLAETLATGSTTFESLRRRKDGTLVYVDISSKVVRDPHRGVSLILSTKKDVTLLRILRDTKLVEAHFRDVLESTPD